MYPTEKQYQSLKSSRFPGKPLCDICGKPMIWWVYQQVLKVKEFDSIYIATKVEGDLFINIQGDGPVIQPERIRQVISNFKDETVYFGTLKKAITDEEEIKSTSTVKVVC